MTEIHLTPIQAREPEVRSDVSTITITQFPCIVGRALDCDQPIDDMMISRRHCTFSLCDDRVCVKDLASRNGTRLNGRPIADMQIVANGDKLQLAQLIFFVHVRQDPGEPPLQRRAADRTELEDPPEAVTGSPSRVGEA